MSETSGVYTGATTASHASVRERELCEERRWEEAGHLLAEIALRIPHWLGLHPTIVGGQMEEPSMSEMLGSYTGSTPGPTASPWEPELFAERTRAEAEHLREEAEHLVAEVARHAQDWFRLPPDVEEHFQKACLEQLRGVRALIDHQIARVARSGRREAGTSFHVE